MGDAWNVADIRGFWARGLFVSVRVARKRRSQAATPSRKAWLASPASQHPRKGHGGKSSRLALPFRPSTLHSLAVLTLPPFLLAPCLPSPPRPLPPSHSPLACRSPFTPSTLLLLLLRSALSLRGVQVAGRPGVAAVLRAGPVPHHLLRGVSEEDVAAFNDGHHEGDIERVLAVVKAVHTSTMEVWEVIRVLRAGWREVEAAVAAAAGGSGGEAEVGRQGSKRVRLEDSAAASGGGEDGPETAAGAAEGEEGRAAALAGMLRLRGLGRFRPRRSPPSSSLPPTGREGAGQEWEVVMPRARDVLRFLWAV